jgi:hypothetical protein
MDRGDSPYGENRTHWNPLKRCEGIRTWRDKLADKRFRNIDAELG